MVGGGGGNGQWVRARTKAGAKSFLAEKQMERERRYASQERGRLRRRRAVATIRRWGRTARQRLSHSSRAGEGRRPAH